MTWGFAYLTCCIVGLVVAAVTGLISDLRAFARHTAAARSMYERMMPPKIVPCALVSRGRRTTRIAGSPAGGAIV